MSNGPRLLSESIPAIAGKAFGRKYIMLGRLVTRWEDIVGADMAAKTHPVKIRYYKAKKQAKDAQATASLDIAASTADATLLHYQKDLILERINQIFGNRWITAIRFVPKAAEELKAPPKRPKLLTEAEKTYLSGMLGTVQDDAIRDRLKTLGAAIMQDKNKKP